MINAGAINANAINAAAHATRSEIVFTESTLIDNAGNSLQYGMVATEPVITLALYEGVLGYSVYESLTYVSSTEGRGTFLADMKVSNVLAKASTTLSFLASLTESLTVEGDAESVSQIVLSAVQSLRTTGVVSSTLSGMMALSEAIALNNLFKVSIAINLQEDVTQVSSLGLALQIALEESIAAESNSDAYRRRAAAIIELAQVVTASDRGFAADFISTGSYIDSSTLATGSSFSEDISADTLTSINKLTAYNLSSLVQFSDSIGSGFAANLEAALSVTGDLYVTPLAVMAALEALLIEDTPVLSARLQIFNVEDVDISSLVDVNAILILALEEGIEIGGVINTPDGSYTAWVLNTETIAPWQYDNFPFNSFAYSNNKYLAAMDSGIYELTGDTDNGAEIQATIKTGLYNFGDMLRKTVNYAYIGYSTDGQLLFKTITTESGNKIERWYTLEERTMNDVTQNRTKLARGLQSAYWQFELENIDGAEFDIDNLKLYPVTLKRRV